MIAILGANGMAGHMITRYLSSMGYNLTTVARNSSDISVNFEVLNDIDNLVDTIKNSDIKFLVNCIGLLIQDSINQPDKAVLLNGWLPLYLEHKFRETDVRVIHISTDCVFDGKVGSYLESDMPNEANLYGRSKAIGEINNDKDITFRTSMIGPKIKSDGTGLMDWFLNKSGDTVTGWDNTFWSGVTTYELARCLSKWIENPNIFGIYHLTNNKSISKYELLEMINKTFKVDKIIVRGKGPKSLDKSLIDSRGNSIFRVKEYHQQMVELKNFMEI